jgi:hypothetical protein
VTASIPLSTEPVTYRALETLRRDFVVSGTTAKLTCPQMEREHYEEVKVVIERLQGQWVAGKKVFRFPYNPTDAIQAVCETACMPRKWGLDFVPTPARAVEVLLDAYNWDNLPSWGHILEPSAGQGAIAKGLLQRLQDQHWNKDVDWRQQMHLVELDAINQSILMRQGWPNIAAVDFLSYKLPADVAARGGYAAVVMNPPFTSDGDKDAYIAHIEHAYSLLREGGVLLAIAPTGAKHSTQKRVEAFRRLCWEMGGIDEMPRDAFKESGTGVATVSILMEKQDVSWKRRPHQGYDTWHAWILHQWARNETKHIADRDAIFTRIRAGELLLDLIGDPLPETRAAFDAYWRVLEAVANAACEGVNATPAVLDELAGVLVEEYREWSTYQENAK